LSTYTVSAFWALTEAFVEYVVAVDNKDVFVEPIYHSYDVDNPPLAVNTFVPLGGIVSWVDVIKIGGGVLSCIWMEGEYASTPSSITFNLNFVVAVREEVGENEVPVCPVISE